MNDLEFIVAGVIGVAALILSIFNCVKHGQTDNEISSMRWDIRNRNRASETMCEFERKHRQEIQAELEALKEYLDVETVKVNPKMQMVERHKLRGKK